MFREVDQGFVADAISWASDPEVHGMFWTWVALVGDAIDMLPSPLVFLIALWFAIVAFYHIQTLTRLRPLTTKGHID